MSVEKLSTITNAPEQNKERVFKRISTLLEAEYQFSKHEQDRDTIKFDYERGDFVTGAELSKAPQEEIRKYIDAIRDVELDGVKYRILGWDVFQKKSERETKNATIMALLESESIHNDDITNFYPVVSENLYSFYNQAQYWLSTYPRSLISTFVSNGKSSRDSNTERRIYTPVFFEGEYPEIIEKVEQIPERRIMPLFEE